MRISDWSSDVCSSDLLLLGIGLLPDRGSTIRFHLHVAVQHKPRCKAPRSRIKRIARCNIGHPTLPPACWPKDRLSVSPRSERSRRKDRKSTRRLQSLMRISYAVFCLTKKKTLRTSEHAAINTTGSQRT